jgi:predicted ABC-type transport system involved in lysophospholipase L1 biosynthesis ATPase subunit
MAEIVLRNLTKRWGSFTGVERTNLTIADQEFLVLLGPSGCGKTTTMRMIAGLEEASEGDILIGGRRVNDLDPKDRDIAMVFQSYALYPNMNVYENIRFPLKVRRVPAARTSRTGHARGRDGRTDRIPGAPPGRAVRGPAPARGPWRGRSCASRTCSSWTSPCPTWTQSSGFRRARRSRTSATS